MHQTPQSDYVSLACCPPSFDDVAPALLTASCYHLELADVYQELYRCALGVGPTACSYIFATRLTQETCDRQPPVQAELDTDGRLKVLPRRSCIISDICVSSIDPDAAPVDYETVDVPLDDHDDRSLGDYGQEDNTLGCIR